LRAGWIADMVLLSHDPLDSISRAEIAKCQVLVTYCAGVKIWPPPRRLDLEGVG